MMGSPSLLDSYQIPADLPDMNVGVDPAAMERLKYLGLMRMGMGMMGREPIGSAMSAGMNTIITGQEQARAEARANMELALKQHQAKQQQLSDLRRAALIKSVPDEQLRAYGVPDPLILGFKTAEKPEQYLQALEQLKDYTLSQGQGRFNAAGGVKSQMPDSAGNIIAFDQNAQPAGRQLLPGAAESAATQKYAEARGTELGKAGATLVDVPLQPGEENYVPGATKKSLLANEISAVTAPTGATAVALQKNPNLRMPQFHGTMSPNEVNRAMQDFTGEKPFQQTAGTRITNPLAVKEAEQKIATQGAQDTEIAKAQGTDYNGIVQAERQAPQVIGKMQLLQSHLAQINTGKLAPSTLALKGYVADVFPNLAKDWTADVPYGQAATALSRELALQMRNPAGGAGMPGSLSDPDRVFLETMIAGSANDPRAIPLMVDAAVKIQERNQEIGKLARDYRTKHKTIDEGFYQEVQDYAKAHPLFGKAAQTTATAPKVYRYNKAGKLIE